MNEGVIVNDGDQLLFLHSWRYYWYQRRFLWNIKIFQNDVNAGERILLDDGKLIFKLFQQIKIGVHKVIQGGELKSKKS
jgi:pyruvate kinase